MLVSAETGNSAVDSRFDKLKTMIAHDGTPSAERAVALDRLIKMIVDGGGPVTRSVRIGHRRQKAVVDEWGRLEPYADGITYGQAIASIYRACRECAVIPTRLDFGFNDEDEAVVAIGFQTGHVPNGLDLQDECRVDWPGCRVSATTDQSDEERTYLLYLGLKAAVIHSTEVEQPA